MRNCEEGRALIRESMRDADREILLTAIADLDREIDGLYGFIDNIDRQIGETLERIGKFPPKPAGFPDRIDVMCNLLLEAYGKKDS